MALPTITLNNTTGSDIVLTQLAVTVPAGGSITVSDFDRPDEVLNDEELQTFLDPGDITVDYTALDFSRTGQTARQSRSCTQPITALDIRHSLGVGFPQLDDDEDAGFNPGSFWLNRDTGQSFQNIDPSVGASLWSPIGGPGQSGMIYEDLQFYIDAGNRTSYNPKLFNFRINDLIGNARVGNINPPATYSEGQLNFDGTAVNGNVSFTKDDNTFLDNIFAGGGTILVWFKANSNGNGGFGHILNTTSGTGEDGWRIFVRGTNPTGLDIVFNHGFTPGGNNFRQWRMSIGGGQNEDVAPIGEWMCLAITYNSDISPAVLTSYPVFYANGVSRSGFLQSGTGDLPALSDTGNPIIVGNRGAGDRQFDGDIGMVCMWDRELSSDEISQVYQATKSRFLNTGMVFIDRAVATTDVSSLTLNGLFSERDGIYFVTGKIVLGNVSPLASAVTTVLEVRPVPGIALAGITSLINSENSTGLAAGTLASSTGWLVGLNVGLTFNDDNAVFFEAWLYPAGSRANASSVPSNSRLWLCNSVGWYPSAAAPTNLVKYESWGSWDEASANAAFESITIDAFNVNADPDLIRQGSEISIFRVETITGAAL